MSGVAWIHSGKRESPHHGVTSRSTSRGVPCSKGMAVAEHAIGGWIGLGQRLCHRSGSRQADLALHLLPSPASGINRTRAEVTVGTGLPNQSSDPVVAEEGSELPIGESIGKITSISQELIHFNHPWEKSAYPMTPIDDLIRPSLLREGS